MSELLSDDRYGRSLIPLIFQIGRRFSHAEFMREIIQPLQHILGRTDPEELALANLSVAPIIIDRVAVEHQCDVLSPLFIASLRSPSTHLRGEALKHIPRMIASMSEQVILVSLLPTLLSFVDQLEDRTVCCAVIECLGQCLAKVHPDAFCERVIPKLLICWQRVRVPQLAAAIGLVLRKMRPSPSALCKYIVPIAAEILSSREAGETTDSALAGIIMQSMAAVTSERNLDARCASWQPEENQDMRIVPPVQVAALNLERDLEPRVRRSRSARGAAKQHWQHWDRAERAGPALQHAATPPPPPSIFSETPLGAAET